MERHEYDPSHIDGYKDAKKNLTKLMSREGMVIVSPDGCATVKFVETGDTDLRSIRAGETEYVTSVPVREPIINHEAATLAELARLKKTKKMSKGLRKYYADQKAAETIITEPGYLEAKSVLPSTEMIRAAAEEAYEARGAIDPLETLACANCDGKKTFESQCSCTWGGVVFMGDDGSESLRKKGEADPDCGECHGSGERISNCPYCEGAGYSYKYPVLILTNDETNEGTAITLDVLELVKSGEVAIKTREGGSDYGATKFGSVGVSLDYQPFLEARMRQIGIDPESVVNENGVSIEWARLGLGEFSLAHLDWRMQDDKSEPRAHYRWSGERRRGGSKGDTSTESALAGAQNAVVHSFAWPHGAIKDDNGVAMAKQWRLREPEPFEPTLNSLVDELAGHGYKLGLGYGFIATEEWGPAFYIVDGSNNPVAEIGTDYRIEDALASAVRAFHDPELQERLAE